MTPRNLTIAILIAAAVLMLLPKAFRVRAQSGGTSTNPRTTQEAFKNIQVLKDYPADELVPAMQFITASLGVECDFCHVRDAFDKDDKKTKQTARKMMQMVSAINQQNFDNQRVVTCYSCHRGSPRPLKTPMVGDSMAFVETPEAFPDASVPESKSSVLPSPSAVLQKYIAAVGGAEAVENVSSRVATGTARFSSGPAFALTVVTKIPGKQITTVHLPAGDSSTTFNGQGGWMRSPGAPVREMHEADLVGARLDADLQFATHLKRTFKNFKVAKQERINDHDAVLLLATNPGQPPLELFFDKDTGLLLRQLRFSKTFLGLNPTRIDYDDYKEFDGIKVPLHLTISHPRTQLEIQLDQVSQNVAVDDAQFEPPPQKPQ